MSYDPNNAFARIIRGDLPSHKVYEDDAALAIMDIAPVSPGHVLVIPKAPSRTLLDADDATLAELIKAVKKIAQAVMSGMGAEGVLIRQFNEAASGQTVFHLHFHVIPVYEGTPLAAHAGGKADDAELASLAKAIAEAL